MQVAVTGAAGLFGHGLVAVLATRHTVHSLTRADADLTKLEEVRTAFSKVAPDVVVHAVGIPDLDICEADPAKAYLVNVRATRHVVEAARERGAAVAYISIEAVFDGKKHEAGIRWADLNEKSAVQDRWCHDRAASCEVLAPKSPCS